MKTFKLILNLILVILLLFINNLRIFSNSTIDSLQNLVSQSDSNKKIPILLELAKNYYIDDNFQEAEYSCLKALELSRSLKDIKSEIQTLNTLAYICSYFEPARVKSICDSSEILSNKIEYEFGLLESQFMGSRVLKTSEPIKALEILRQIIKSSEKLKFIDLTASAKAQSGEIYRSLGNYLEATRIYLEAHKLFNQILEKNPSRFNKYLYGSLLNNLGITYKKLNNDSEAQKYYEEFLKISLNIEDTWGIASCYNNLGNLKNRNDEPDEALEYYSKAAQELKKLNSDRSLADVYLNMAIIFLTKKENSKSLNLFNKSLNIYQNNYDSIGIARVKVNLGDFWFVNNDLIKSEDYLYQALNIMKTQNDKSLYMEICEKISNTSEKLGKFETALKFYKEYTELKDTLLNSGKAQEIGTLTTNFENELKISEEKRKEDIDSRATFRRNILEYLLISIFIIIIFTLVMLLPRFGFKTTTIESMVFVTFLFTFEFLNSLLNPVQDMISEGDPLILFGTNLVIALAFIPLDTYLEKVLRNRGVARKK